MPQIVKLQPEIEWHVPDDQCLVSKVEYDSLLNQSTEGRLWKMKDLRNWLGNKDDQWIREYILNRPIFKREFVEMEQKHLLHISNGHGDSWWFKASAMTEWLEKHWNMIEWDGKIKR